ncbi:MAG: transporter substrate-binding domain-containing protein [Deltaproteobacteria bacterium]|jgi:L-cystine transport system substrate-binding protein|nr:transporter substrate-binding domain-containing protein [Deltaproteobacteria bacterium]
MANRNLPLRLALLALLAVILSSFYPDPVVAQDGPKTIYVATQPDFPPFFFIDESDRLTGYDVEVVRGIFERLPEYKLEFSVSAWDGILLGLESNKTQMVAVGFNWTEERAEKYNLSEPYFQSQNFLAVKKGRTDINSLEDLRGKTLAAVVGTGVAAGLQKWNDEHGGQIDIRFVKASGNMADPLIEVADGRVDAWVEEYTNINRVLQEKNLNVQIVGEPVLVYDNVFAFRKDEEGTELRSKVDAIIKELKKDGTLSRLAIKWIGTDKGVPK